MIPLLAMTIMSSVFALVPVLSTIIARIHSDNNNNDNYEKKGLTLLTYFFKTFHIRFHSWSSLMISFLPSLLFQKCHSSIITVYSFFISVIQSSNSVEPFISVTQFMRSAQLCILVKYIVYFFFLLLQFSLSVTLFSLVIPFDHSVHSTGSDTPLFSDILLQLSSFSV